ncbi:MAG: hypothetical protein E7Y34_01490 [Mycoplasma sp.]|nr:hypothetical protein [Mycoplasma sp.]
MLLDNFNKLGGTEFRVKNQINGLSQIIYWIFDIQKNKKQKIKDFSWDIEFKNWINREQIYTYKKDINRFDMITSFLTNKIPILEFNPVLNEFYLSKTIINNSKTYINP